ncbi:MAG: hypothetical protein WD470_09890 [Rhodospirillaceae bacterium]
MRDNIHVFAPDITGAKPSQRPLPQLVRDAEIARARQGALLVASAWAVLRNRFPGGTKAAARKTPEEDARLAA